MSQDKVIDLKTLLKIMEPFVKDPTFLHSGRKIAIFNLLPREVWGNWLLCAVLQKIHDTSINFVGDNEGDGILVDVKTGQIVQTEHVSALEIPAARKLPTGDERIIQAVEHKIVRGPDYAKGKFLIVFFDGAISWIRKNVREAINRKYSFKAIYCIGLELSGPTGYSYTITQFHPKTPNESVSYKIRINSDFTDWSVFLLQDIEGNVIEVPIEKVNYPHKQNK